MTEAVPTPVSLPALSQHASHDASGRWRLSEYHDARTLPFRSGEPHLAAPGSLANSTAIQQRTQIIEGLRRRVQAIERPRLAMPPEHGPQISPQISPPPARATPGSWMLGVPELDALLGLQPGPLGGLDPAGCHEVKPASGKAGAYIAALAFALALARRRLDAQTPSGPQAARPTPRILGCTPRILWCAPRHLMAEFGALHAPGLARFGLAPQSLLMVETRRNEDVLWVLEEALRCKGLLIAIGCLDGLKLTPARRLSLAAKEGGTPSLLVTAAHTPPAGAMATRWRIGPAPSASHLHDARTPGQPHLAVTLERCRRTPVCREVSLTLEWSDATHRFRMAAPLADRTAAPPHAWRRAG